MKWLWWFPDCSGNNGPQRYSCKPNKYIRSTEGTLTHTTKFFLSRRYVIVCVLTKSADNVHSFLSFYSVKRTLKYVYRQHSSHFLSKMIFQQLKSSKFGVSSDFLKMCNFVEQFHFIKLGKVPEHMCPSMTKWGALR